MGFFDIFRRAPAIREAGALADFIDDNAAFLIQKGMYEYSRARAGHYAKVLLQEPEFLAAIEKARWQGFPLGLAMVGEMVEKRAACRRSRTIAAPGLMRLARAGAVGVRPLSGAAAVGRAGLGGRASGAQARRLDQIGLHPPKFVKDIPVPLAELYFDLMPIHEKLRAPDFPAITNYLRVSLINIHDALIKRLDVAAVVQSLLAERVR